MSKINAVSGTFSPDGHFVESEYFQLIINENEIPNREVIRGEGK